MADIFLSYSHHDRARAADIVEALTDAGFSVFWDQSTPSGADWNHWIRDQLNNARLCVTLWSRHSVESRNVVHESTIALEEDKFVPVLIDDLRPEQFPMGFYTMQAVDSRSRTAASLARILTAVRAKLRGVDGDAETPGAKVYTLYPAGRAPLQPRPSRRARSGGLAGPAIAGVLAAYALLAAAGYAPEAMAHIGAALSSDAPEYAANP